MYQYFEFVVGAVLLTGLIDRNYKTQGQTDNQNFKLAVSSISNPRLNVSVFNVAMITHPLHDAN